MPRQSLEDQRHSLSVGDELIDGSGRKRSGSSGTFGPGLNFGNVNSSSRSPHSQTTVEMAAHSPIATDEESPQPMISTSRPATLPNTPQLPPLSSTSDTPISPMSPLVPLATPLPLEATQLQSNKSKRIKPPRLHVTHPSISSSAALTIEAPSRDPSSDEGERRNSSGGDTFGHGMRSSLESQNQIQEVVGKHRTKSSSLHHTRPDDQFQKSAAKDKSVRRGRKVQQGVVIAGQFMPVHPSRKTDDSMDRQPTSSSFTLHPLSAMPKSQLPHKESRRSSPSSIAKETIDNRATTFLRPAPPPPSSRPISLQPQRYAPVSPTSPRQHPPSPETSPSSQLNHPHNGISPRHDQTRENGGLGSFSPGRYHATQQQVRQGEQGVTDLGEVVEIPRFKKRELNLSMVERNGMGFRILWIALWFWWIVNGLASLFFDVNMVYILAQCIQFANGNRTSWTFATVAYGICWGVSTLLVWAGWEVWYEFWRRWRLARPAIEPIHTSLPASLHLSLLSFPHFSFLLHIRASPLYTPHRMDILPESAHLLLQLLPGLLPQLPRAGIAVVILITFRNGTTGFPSQSLDDRFFTSFGALTHYALGVVSAIIGFVAVKLLVVLWSAATLLVFHTRSPFSRRLSLASNHETLPNGNPVTPKRQRIYSTRDPALTPSPQKTWWEAESSGLNAIGFSSSTSAAANQSGWRDRMRSRIQDAYELCMIRRGGVMTSLMASGSYVVVAGAGGGITASPTPRRTAQNDITGMAEGTPLPDRNVQGQVEELTDPANDTLVTSQPMEISRTASSRTIINSNTTPKGKLAGPASTHRQPSKASLHSQHTGISIPSDDVFYTPRASATATPTIERGGLAPNQSVQSSPGAKSNLSGNDIAPARPESGTMAKTPSPGSAKGDEEMNSDLDSDHREKRFSDESGRTAMSGLSGMTSDSTALLSTQRPQPISAETVNDGDAYRHRDLGSPRRGSLSGNIPGSSAKKHLRRRSKSTSNETLRQTNNGQVTNTPPMNKSPRLDEMINAAENVLHRARSGSLTLLKEGVNVVRKARSGSLMGDGSGDSNGNLSGSPVAGGYTKVDKDENEASITETEKEVKGLGIGFNGANIVLSGNGTIPRRRSRLGLDAADGSR